MPAISTISRTVARDPRFRFVRADIADRTKMRELDARLSRHMIMHLAAESHVDRSIDGPGAFIQTNVVGTFSCSRRRSITGAQLEPARERRFPLSSRLDRRGLRLARRGGATSPRRRPTSRTRPIRPSKAASDHLVRAWHHTYGLPIVLSNCSNNYGPYHFPEKLIPLHDPQRARGQARCRSTASGENVRDWLYVEDHARALILIAEQGGVGESYNVGGESETTQHRGRARDLRDRSTRSRPIATIGPREQLITFVEDRPGHDLRYAIDAV